MKILKHSLIVLAMSLLVAARAATNTVTSTADNSSAGSLRTVVTNAAAGDTIIFTNTLSGQTILLTNGPITLNVGVTIDASMLARGISIDGNHAGTAFPGSVFRSTAGTNILTALTITNGYAVVFGGGGIFNVANLTLNRCTLVGNSTTASGGAFLNEVPGTVTLNQCTLAGNSAGNVGGAIYNLWTLTVNQSTLTGNTAGNAGGGIRNTTTNALYNSIVAGNSAPADSEIGTSGATLITTGVNLTNGAPLLAPLGNYGGPTPTMPPLPGSPAINGCTSGTTFTNDQRGALRVSGPFADIGAVEGVFDPGFQMINPTRLGNGSFQFSFTNLAGASFTVFTSTNVAFPLNQWSNLGPAAEILPNTGQYQFTDPQATNASQRFYTVRSP